MKKNIVIKLILIAILFSNTKLFSQIKINEVCAANSASYYDEDNDTPDWIELYNYSNEPVNMKNWRISDNSDYESAWQLPDTIVQPGGYLLVMASGKNRVSEGNISMNVHSGLSIVPFNNRDGYRFRYKKVWGDFEATLNVKTMRNEGVWAVVGLQARISLTDTTNFFATLATSKARDAFFNYKREKTLESPNWLALYGNLNLPYTKLWLKREADTLYSAYIDVYGNKLQMEKYPNYLTDTLYLGVSVSGFNDSKFAEFIISDLTINSENENILDLDVYEVNTIIKGYDFAYRELHADFSLSEGETLYLFEPSGSLDSVAILKNTSDITQIFENSKWLISDKPTPAEDNAEGYISRLPQPSISFINNRLVIEDTTDSEVFYTVNNTFPTKESNKYIPDNTKYLDKTTTVIAQSFKDGYLSSLPVAQTYIKEDMSFDMPIVAISTDSLNLWGENGIFIEKNFLLDLKKKATFEYLDFNNNHTESNTVLIKLHGNNTRYYPQKSLRIYAESLFGNKRLKNNYFKQSDIKEYDQLILRNGGTDWSETFIKDAYNHVVSKQLKNQIHAEYKPVLMYLNSKFYGMVNLRERIDDDFLSEKFGIDDVDINFYEDYGIHISGDFHKYNNFYEKVMNLSKNEENFEFIKSLIDIDNFNDYIVLETFASNYDWPWKNVKMFQSDSLDSRFRYILQDLDWTYSLFGFEPYDNKISSLVIDTTNHLPRIFQKFIENEKFRVKFLQNTCDAVNSVFKPDNMIRILDSLAEQIRPVIPLHRTVWEQSCVEWETKLEEMRNYINRRPEFFMKNFDYHLNNDNGRVQFSLSTFPANSGTFKVNSITIDTSDWQGRYFQTIPVTITAVPKHGMKFVKWNHDSLGTEPTITTTMPETYHIEAIYEQDNPQEKDEYIVINEIMYNADKDEDTKDWVELYNAGKNPVNLKGWSFIDEDDTHPKFTIEEEYTIQPDEYLILTRDVAEFEKFISIPNKKIGDFQFGLGGNDILRLYDANGNLHDSVNYDNDTPWPLEADGSGYTIELRNPVLDNNIGSNWERSQELLGTPGKINSNYDTLETSIEYSSQNNDITIWKENNNLFVKSNDFINEINIYDVRGKLLISKEISTKYLRNETVDINTLKRGVYIVLVKTKSGLANFKLLIEE